VKVVYTILLLTCSFAATAQVDTVINRYKRYLITIVGPGAVDSNWLQTDTAYRWNDIRYNDTERANWQLLHHLKRLRSMAMVWCDPQSTFYHNTVYLQVIHGALDHWLTKRYRNSNWWHNEIGVPQYMRDIVVLLRDVLSPTRLKQALEVMAQYRLYPNSTGANLVWSADLGVHYGALTGDTVLMQTCLQRIWKEVVITTGDGIQPDYSFHQHGARLMMYQYGRAFLRDNIRLAWQVRGTSWAYPADKTSLLTDFILEGWQWMARGIHTVPGTMDRSVSRADELRNADIRDLLPYLYALNPQKQDRFRALAAWQNNNYKVLKGFRYYPYADFAVYHNEQFSFFLKTISDRTLPTESINNENLKGKLLNSGDGYFVRNGNEYFNLMPVWNWNLLPGVTGFKGADSISRRPFTGSVGNGRSGATAMDYRMKDNAGKWISTRKFWACHNNRVVCLVAGVQTNHTEEVLTALDQCRLQGEVTVNMSRKPLQQGNYAWNKVRWIHHAGLAYIFLQPQPVQLHINTVTGSWYGINRSASREPVTEKVFMPVLKHTTGASTAYLLAAAQTPAQANALMAAPGCKIIRNDTLGQAVYFNDNTAMMAFYKPGTITIHKAVITVDRPCLLQVSDNTIYVSDPSQNAQQVNIAINGRQLNIQLPGHGQTSAGLLLY
jgi:chondroitin AC lyase